uniref:CCHC-type domain-containing protein n=1 Tax=Peronospora matthiolae TaxID=2874970 RepID=A0AAV1US04_9STRA
MLSRLDTNRLDYLRQAEELAQLAQSTEVDTHTKNFGRDVMNSVEPVKELKEKSKTRTTQTRIDARKCFKCGEVGHIRSRCPQGKKKSSGAIFVFMVARGANDSQNQWILDRGSSRHLVNGSSIHTDAIPYNSECTTAATDGSALRITLQGTADVQVVAFGVVNTVGLLNVQYAENLERNIISFGLLEVKGCVLEYRGGRRVLSSRVGGKLIMNAESFNNVLVVTWMSHNNRTIIPSRDSMIMVMDAPDDESVSDVHCGTLKDFHRRLGHFCRDTVLKMAEVPASCIRLTDTTRQKCMACAKGKQTKTAHSKRDTGANSPIDVIGGVTCSDLKGPMIHETDWATDKWSSSLIIGQVTVECFCPRRRMQLR